MAKKEGKIRWGKFIPWMIYCTILGGIVGYVRGVWTGAVVGVILGGIIGLIVGYLQTPEEINTIDIPEPKIGSATINRRASSTSRRARSTSKKDGKNGWVGDANFWALIIFGLIGFGIGVYLGFSWLGFIWYGWIGAVVFGIVGFIGGAFFFALSGGVRDD